MPGLAKTNKFLLSTATVMVGPMEDLHGLNPTEHSIGLVKNFSMTADPAYTELTQGITNQVVMSVKTAEGMTCSMEVYEYTLRNLGYAAGLDASGVSFDSIDAMTPLSSAALAAAMTVEVATDVSASIMAGDWIFIQEGTGDKVHVARVASSVFATETTITLATGFGIPVGGFSTAARIGRVKRVDVGGQTAQPEMAAKVVGLLPKNNEPFTILIPKMKVTGGLSVAFSSDNFGNLPFEFSLYAGIPSDPMYAEFGESSAILFPR